ncbi:EVE domain-containing protein [Geopsychrobacter electrodiphilus]|uniref:EVE domain-containing protein n=1 Tax=Geopsychrobacter electrodiphilus TaxID=225196 RepID=UPI000381300B|nr:EVE domain-containing protein [Geopsychrobacter electrodiphilus]
MNYWLMKSEPEAFSIDDLAQRPEQTEHWDGVRNYQARNMMRDEMRLGDQVLFYHSNCKPPGIVGIAQVLREGYPDFTAFDPRDKHFDEKSDPQQPRWFMVDVQLVRKLKRLISLEELRLHEQLEGMKILQRGNRLSITPVSRAHWEFILGLEGENSV